MLNSVTLRQNARRRHGLAETTYPPVKTSLDGRTAKRSKRRTEACGAMQKEAVGLISRQMAEGVGGEAGPGAHVKITTPHKHTYVHYVRH